MDVAVSFIMWPERFGQILWRAHYEFWFQSSHKMLADICVTLVKGQRLTLTACTQSRHYVLIYNAVFTVQCVYKFQQFPKSVSIFSYKRTREQVHIAVKNEV